MYKILSKYEQKSTHLIQIGSYFRVFQCYGMFQAREMRFHCASDLRSCAL